MQFENQSIAMIVSSNERCETYLTNINLCLALQQNKSSDKLAFYVNTT